MHQPMAKETHQKLVELIYQPFHSDISQLVKQKRQSANGPIYHLDLHSMPSVGTKMHKDPGERRADIVVSDSLGKSSRPEFVDLVISSYVRAGFKVGYNWPYQGGRLTEHYGKPAENHHTVQVELNRCLYMNEENKKVIADKMEIVKSKLEMALGLIESKLSAMS